MGIALYISFPLKRYHHTHSPIMARTFFVGGNFKMNGSNSSIKEIVNNLNSASLDPNTEVVVSPPSIFLQTVRESLNKKIGVAAQTVSLKTKVATEAGVSVIWCCGESLEEREAGTTIEVVSKQLASLKSHISDWSRVVVAYEPIWAIGTGKVATTSQAQEVHKAIREWLAKNVSDKVAEETRILYGGSVNEKNCGELAQQPDIDGFLVGGASLKPAFVDIVNAKQQK